MVPCQLTYVNRAVAAKNTLPEKPTTSSVTVNNATTSTASAKASTSAAKKPAGRAVEFSQMQLILEFREHLHDSVMLKTRLGDEKHERGGARLILASQLNPVDLLRDRIRSSWGNVSRPLYFRTESSSLAIRVGFNQSGIRFLFSEGSYLLGRFRSNFPKKFGGGFS